MKVEWIKHTEYDHWRLSRNLTYGQIRWVGTVQSTPGDREVVLRALQNGSSFLIKVRERVEDRIWEDDDFRYVYDGNPYIILSSTGILQFREGFNDFQEACNIAITKYVKEFMNVGDLEKIRRRIIL